MCVRCEWVSDNILYKRYHDEEWGREERDDKKLFEHLVLDTHQPGLSWLTVLKKRENYRKSFDDFDPVKISLYDEKKVEELMLDSGIIRNRRKIESTVRNARCFLEVCEEFSIFSEYVWSFVGGRVKVNAWKNMSDMPVKTKESVNMSKDMKKRGFSFVGPIVCYSFMQATGMVFDHTTDCFLYKDISSASVSP